VGYIQQNHALLTEFIDRVLKIKFALVVYYGFDKIDSLSSLEGMDEFDKWREEIIKGWYDTEPTDFFEENMNAVKTAISYLKTKVSIKRVKEKILGSKTEGYYIHIEDVVEHHQYGKQLRFWESLMNDLHQRHHLKLEGKGKTEEQICDEKQKAMFRTENLTKKVSGLEQLPFI
jgi:hypothetical protein